MKEITKKIEYIETEFEKEDVKIVSQAIDIIRALAKKIDESGARGRSNDTYYKLNDIENQIWADVEEIHFLWDGVSEYID